MLKKPKTATPPVIKGYLSNQNLKRVGQNIPFTKEQIEEWVKCANDPTYFTKKYFKIVDIDEGLVPFDMWPYQEDLLNIIHENRFVISKLARQIGKSTTLTAYVLWSVLFQPYQTIGILADKEDAAKEMMHRIQLAYENIPRWMQHGVVEFNKKRMELENGSVILCSGTTANSFRGKSITLLVLDEFAFVEQNIADRFFQSVFPTISSGKKSKIVMISTPSGFNHFYKFWKEAEEGKNGYVPFSVHWSDCPKYDQKWYESTIAQLGQDKFTTEFECVFAGGENTLISPAKLKTISSIYKTPEKETPDGLYIYKEPVQHHAYMAFVDVSEGTGLDYHATSIIDITKTPYEQVAVFRNNQLDPLKYPEIIHQLALKYNDAWTLIELNANGTEIANTLFYDLEYENLLTVTKTKKGQVLSHGMGGSTRMQLGVKTTVVTKSVGCSRLKTLIENDQLIIPDFNTIKEFSKFTLSGKTFKADEGATDDIVMTLVLFGWTTGQEFFTGLTNQDLAAIIKKEKSDALEELAVYPVFDNGIDQNQSFFEAGDRWYPDTCYQKNHTKYDII